MSILPDVINRSLDGAEDRERRALSLRVAEFTQPQWDGPPGRRTSGLVREP